jgi:DNA-binding XRE family transcriptional regulator
MSVSNEKKTLKELRLEKGLTQEELSRLADVSLFCVIYSERRNQLGATIPGARIAEVLGLPSPEPRRHGPRIGFVQKNPTGVGATIEMEATP